jgi:hypothetical protein
MQQRRVRLGDILDDYCPRERRITNHAVVAMIEDTVKQTRCTTCDADHEYRDGKAPSPRKRKAAVGDGVLVTGRARPVLAAAEPELELSEEPLAVPTLADRPEAPVLDDAPLAAAVADSVHEGDVDADLDADGEPAGATDRDEWPVHRPLIRATLPRPEGQVPERKAPDFTFRPAGGRFDSPRNGQRNKGGGTGGGHRPARQAQGQPGQGQGRFGGGPRAGSGHGSRQGAGHGPGQGQGHAQGQRHGNRAGGNRPAQSRGPRQGGGGRKRGR